jgi:uncharacterized protein YbaR (Trm112 family)
MILDENELDDLFNKLLYIKCQNVPSIYPQIKMPPFGNYLINTVEDYSPTIPNEVYCPVCKKSYPLTQKYFTYRERRVFDIKNTDYVECKTCRSRSLSNGYKTKVRRISLDPAFGLKLTAEELASALQDMANGYSLNKIAETLTEGRKREPVYKNAHAKLEGELICKKTIRDGFYRIAPIIGQYIVDRCKPRIVDEILVFDITHFTHREPVLDDDNIVDYKLINRSVATITGKYSTAIYGYGVAISKITASRKCIEMANKYVPGMLSQCLIKYDGDKDIRKALVEAGGPEKNLISIPKKEYKGGINEIEGFFSKPKGRLKKHRFRKLPSIYAGMTAFFASWNLFERHTLFDGKWRGTIAELLQIKRPPSSWLELVNISWRYMLTDKTLYEAYYPKTSRGVNKIKHRTLRHAKSTKK